MGGLLKGVDEWEERDDYSFRVTLVCVYERGREGGREGERENFVNDAIVSLYLLTYCASFVHRAKCFCSQQNLTRAKLTR